MFGFGFSEEEIIEALSELPEDELEAMRDALNKARLRRNGKQIAKSGMTNHGSPAPKAPAFPEIDIDTQPYAITRACDCGAAKVGGRHYDWCSLSV